MTKPRDTELASLRARAESAERRLAVAQTQNAECEGTLATVRRVHDSVFNERDVIRKELEAERDKVFVLAGMPCGTVLLAKQTAELADRILQQAIAERDEARAALLEAQAGAAAMRMALGNINSAASHFYSEHASGYELIHGYAKVALSHAAGSSLLSAFMECAKTLEIVAAFFAAAKPSSAKAKALQTEALYRSSAAIAAAKALGVEP